jgi:hypothetical protein
MTLCLGTVPASSTLYIPFTTYDGSDGSSVTCTGLAVTDIEIYKNGSTTQRASDAGYALLDTDGIDFDSVTGLHGFSIDLSDNTDAGFFEVGSWYWVVVSAITVDSQTVTFLAAIFRIGPAEAITGYPVTDAGAISGDATAADTMELFVEAIDQSTGQLDSGSFAAGAITADVIANAAIDAATFAADVDAEAAGWIWKDTTAGNYTVAGSIGKSLFTSGNVPGAAGGLFIAGSNAATTAATWTVTGASTNGSTVLGNTTIGTLGIGTLTQTGAASLGAGSTVTLATLAVTGAVSVGSTTTLTGNVLLNGSLGIASDTTFTGSLTMKSLTVNQGTTLTGAVALGSTLAVAGTTTFAAINTGAIGFSTLTSSGLVTLESMTVTNAMTWGSWVVTAAAAYPLLSADTGATYVARAPSGTETLDTIATDIAAVSAQISAIGSGTGAALNFAVDADNASAPLNGITKKGTETGTYANTLADDGTVHSIAADLDTGVYYIDWVYGFSAGAGRNATKVVIRANMGAVGDTVTVQAYNFLTSVWDTRTTISGTTETLRDIPLLAGHTGTGTLAGKVYVRFTYSEADAGTLVIDEAYVQAQNLGQTVGYADGSIWVDTVSGAEPTAPTAYVDGTADNPIKTWAHALTLATTVGIRSFRFLPSSSIQLTADSTGYRFVGDVTIDLNGQAIANAFFRDCYTISGTSTGDDWMMQNCGIGTATLYHGYAIECRLKGTITTVTGNDYLFNFCADNVTTGEATIVMTANANVYMRDYRGGIQINALTAGSEFIIDGAGRILLADTCTGGTLTIRGHFPEIVGGAGYLTAAQFVAAGGSYNDYAMYNTDQINTEVDTALNTAIPGTPTADSINERIATMDGLLLGTIAAGTHNAQSGDAYAYLGTNLGALGAAATALAPSATALSTVTWTATRAGYLDTLPKLDTTLVLDGAVYDFTAAALAAAPSSGLDAAGVRSAIGMASANLDTQLSAISGYVDCLPASWVTVPTAIQIADAMLIRDVDNVEASAPKDSLCAVVLALWHGTRDADSFTVNKTDGTEFATGTISEDATLNPVGTVS